MVNCKSRSEWLLKSLISSPFLFISNTQGCLQTQIHKCFEEVLKWYSLVESTRIIEFKRAFKFLQYKISGNLEWCGKSLKVTVQLLWLQTTGIINNPSWRYWNMFFGYFLKTFGTFKRRGGAIERTRKHSIYGIRSRPIKLREEVPQIRDKRKCQHIRSRLRKLNAFVRWVENYLACRVRKKVWMSVYVNPVLSLV